MQKAILDLVMVCIILSVWNITNTIYILRLDNRIKAIAKNS